MTLNQAREKRDECRAWLSQGLDPRIENKDTFSYFNFFYLVQIFFRLNSFLQGQG
ncbi:Arm DNA-binding domain-containing protein [Enterobacter chuandaensis]|nr:Arm DNA-binding domain-containing protein [Enterobacter chuandaensis]MCW4780837.1 Arm DNA-binding domain-containing protein [Enterobacter chuandaensis]MDA4758685.1 Arm DNA-binding domain-containing protein [Enterobacter chuandaensis]